MRRRDFLKLSATSAAGAIIFQACDFDEWGDGSPAREFDIESPRDTPEDYLFGGDAWYATVFSDSTESPGTVVRVFEGRAKKIDGNPNHPVNNGKLNARGQAQLQDLYHPDRIRTPARRIGAGETGFEDASWNEAFDALAEIVQGSQGSILVITAPLSGALKHVVDSFVEGVGGERFVYEPLEESAMRAAVARVFGSDQIPFADIANAQTVLSFGADWLHTWLSPVQYSQAYAAFRADTVESPRGVLYHVDTHMNGTSGAADRWLAVNPGYEGVLAMAIAGVIAEDGGGGANVEGFNAIVGDSPRPTLEEAEALTGVSADLIREVAERLVNNGPSVVFGGGNAGAHTNGAASLSAIYGLNVLLGSVNSPGGLLFPGELAGPFAELGRDAGATDQDWLDMVARIQGGEFSTVLIHQANPVYHSPWGDQLAVALANAENVISFSRYIDETTVHADWLMPGQTSMESWDSVVPAVLPGYPVVGIQQPVVLRFYDTQPFGDVLLTIAEEVGLAEALPWTTMQEVVQEQAEQLRTTNAGNIQSANDFATFWVELVQTGVWFNPEGAQGEIAGSGEPIAIDPPQYAGDEEEYPFFLVPFESTSLGAGQYAYLPWMQALPDPITTVTWSSWASLNKETAEELELGTGDIARVSTSAGELEVQVYVNPATPPNVVAIPMGQGHTYYTRFAEGRGVNVMKILDANLRDEETGALAWAAMRANVQRVPGEFEKLPRMEGTVDMTAPDEYEVVRSVPPEHGEEE